jgi:hypothetical protein
MPFTRISGNISRPMVKNAIGFVIPSASATEASLPLNAREVLVTLRADRALKTKFAEIQLNTFRLSLKSEYPV